MNVFKRLLKVTVFSFFQFILSLQLGKTTVLTRLFTWLDPATPKEHAEQMVLIQGESPVAFEWFKVDRAIGNVRNQGRALIEPFGQIQGDDDKSDY